MRTARAVGSVGRQDQGSIPCTSTMPDQRMHLPRQRRPRHPTTHRTLKQKMVTMYLEPACPECEQGKHINCDGTAWDYEYDVPVRCACEITAHTMRFEELDAPPPPT